jgi:hypothetical protein
MPASNRPEPKEIDSEHTSLSLIQALLARAGAGNAQGNKQQPSAPS